MECGFVAVCLTLYLLWEYRLSASAKFLCKLRLEEPEFYSRYVPSGLERPSRRICVLSEQGSFLKITSTERKAEFISLSERLANRQMLRFLTLPAIVLLMVVYLILFA